LRLAISSPLKLDWTQLGALTADMRLMMNIRALGQLVSLVSVVGLLGGCGKEIGRVPFTAEGAQETKVHVEAGRPLALWTSLNVEYDGDLEAAYDVELRQGDSIIGAARCNPFDISLKTGATEVRLGAKQSIKYSGKMRCTLSPTASGEATLRAKLDFPAKPASLTVKDLSLVVKS